MKILLVTKWIDGGVKEDFHHSGEWIDTFELTCALSDLKNDVAIVSPKPNSKHKKKFQEQYGEILKKKKIKHYYAKSFSASGSFEGSLMFRLDIATLLAYRNFKPEVIQFMQFTNSLAPIFINNCLISYYGVILPKNFINKDKDDRERIKSWSLQNASITRIFENYLYIILTFILGKKNFYNHPEGIMIAKHKKAYTLLKKETNNRIFYVNKGVNLKKINFSKNNNQNILFMSALIYRKGIFDLLEAFKKISQDFPKVRLFIAGTGPSQIVNELKMKAEEIGKTVEIIGPVYYKDKLKILKNATIFCLPSYSDASPAAIMEAMAAGLPIITTRQADTPIKNQVEGILVDPGDIDSISLSIKTLLLNPNNRRKLGISAKNRIKGFSWTKQAQKLIKIYEREAKL